MGDKLMNRKEYRESKRELKKRWEYQIKDDRNKRIIDSIYFILFLIGITALVIIGSVG